MSFAEKWKEEGGLAGWIERNRGKLGFILGLPVGGGLYHIARSIPEYIKNYRQRQAKENVKYLLEALKEEGIELPHKSETYSQKENE